MKKLFLLQMLVCIYSTGCKKDVARPAVTPSPPPQAPVTNTAPKIFMGANMSIILPADSAFLYGIATDAENNIVSYQWSQLSGPNQAIIQTPDSSRTKVSKLVQGDYHFELTVTDSERVSVKDTMQVLVLDTLATATKVLIFRDLEAVCFGPECTVVVDYSNTNFDPGQPFKIFLKSMDSSYWNEVVSPFYQFSSADKWFVIDATGLDDFKKWEVMILY